MTNIIKPSPSVYKTPATVPPLWCLVPGSHGLMAGVAPCLISGYHRIFLRKHRAWEAGQCHSDNVETISSSVSLLGSLIWQWLVCPALYGQRSCYFLDEEISNMGQIMGAVCAMCCGGQGTVMSGHNDDNGPWWPHSVTIVTRCNCHPDIYGYDNLEICKHPVSQYWARKEFHQ